jgi:hypothetical protein
MKLRKVHGLVATGAAAVALLAGCTGGRGQEPQSAPTPSVSASSAVSSAPGAIGPADENWDKIASTPAAGRPAAGKPAPPVIGRVWTTPQLPCDAIKCTLSPPDGTLTFHAQVSGATRVEFFLVPTGTNTAGLERSIGLDRNGRDGWTASYTYADEPLWSHLTVSARGPGGTDGKLPFNLYHPEPLGPTIGLVWTEPELSCQDVWCTLPAGAGTLTIHADVRDALGGVTFWLVHDDPQGGDPPPPQRAPILIGTAFDRGHGYSVTWPYPDRPLRAYVRITAGNNLGSRSATALGLIHG